MRLNPCFGLIFLTLVDMTIRKKIYSTASHFVALLRCLFVRSQASLESAPVALTITADEPVAVTDRRYLSYSIDISVLAGGYWWEGALDVKRGLGTLRVSPINLNIKKLDKLVKLLGPAYLRVGGSEADKIHYFDNPDKEPDALVLTHQQWDDLHRFIQRNDLKLIFTCKYGLFKRRQQGHWEGEEVLALLEYSKRKGYVIDVFELGNELNAYWAFHGITSQPRASMLARDYDRFSELVRSQFPQARISGPGSAFWPRLGETVRPVSNITPRFLAVLKTPLDIVDWHYYPFQSDRSPVRTRKARIEHLVNPSSFEYFRRYSNRLQSLRKRYQPQAQLWTGETGSAQCGGQPELSDRWVSSFWWADQLGMGARLGQKVMVRQSLIGGDYGMIARLTLKPRPDFWVSWLWGQLMGQQVFSADSDDPYIRVYLHSARSGSGNVLMLINLKANAVQVTLPFGGQVKVGEGYELSAKTLTSKRIRINGSKLRFKSGKVVLDDFPAVTFAGKLSGHSISFWRCYDCGQGSASSE